MKIYKLLIMVSAAFLVCGCYEDYVRDYDHDAVYIAYQYNLRSFVVGEGMEFEIGAMLAGVMNNDRDRAVVLEFDDALVNSDLSALTGSMESFTAFDVMSGISTQGAVSNAYVKDAVVASGITGLAPLPTDLYTSGPMNVTIPKGRHTATVSIKADSVAFISDPNAGHDPYYALAYKIVSADADKVLPEKSFSIVAVRLESRFFGTWYHGGVSKVVDDATQDEKSVNTYYTKIPTAEGTTGLYTLRTSGAYKATVDWFHNAPGSMDIECVDGRNLIVSDADGKITDLGSSWNEDKLLQGRKLYLNYKYSNGDGTSTVVTDTLTFRNRIRDGVNEYQDANPEHYK